MGIVIVLHNTINYLMPGGNERSYILKKKPIAKNCRFVEVYMNFFYHQASKV